MLKGAHSHRGEDELGDVIYEGAQASGQVNALGAGLHTLVEDLNEVVQAVLVHGVYEGQVSHDKVQHAAPLWHCLVLLSGRVDLCLCVLRLLHPLRHHLCSTVTAGQTAPGSLP